MSEHADETGGRGLRHRKMQAILQALENHREGRETAALCPVCAGSLRVAIDERLGSTWVTCDSGCTSAHFKWSPSGHADEASDAGQPTS